ncbi:rRNA maturation RNase YbeY [Dissulfurispira sp.]|uniref:rRNA maturation RNase YbeY n=1 Tax=Dissulfurispira sp. TaxID=2817609 RepID=UPI002FDAF6E4
MEITIRNNQRLIRINQRRIESILKKVLKHLTLNHRRYSFIESAEISVLFVNDRKMRELNLQYRGKDKTTDVLSFPQIEQFKQFKRFELLTSLGDIVINLPQAKRQAKEHGLTLYNEIAWLLIHGALHLLGYDHEKNKYQARKMREMEKELLGVLE